MITTKKKRRAIAAAALVVASAGVLAASQPASAVVPQASLPGSTFEIDVNANLKYDGGPAPLLFDWGNLAHANPGDPEKRGTDLPTGQNDNSYVGGTKEDTVCPGSTFGSIPNNKSDLLTVHAYQESGGFFDFAWSRVTEPSGTTLMDFEFNQGTQACPGSPNIQRTIGDRLIEYSIDQGGVRATITSRTWDGAQWGPASNLSANNPACGGGPCAVGTINTTAIADVDADGIGAKSARTFGEAQIDLRLFGGGGANPCVNFGFMTVKSRASDSFTSQIKDFIAPLPVGLGNCAQVTIRKVTDPAGDATLFSFNSTAVTSPVTSGAFQLSGAAANNTKVITNVVQGNNYTVTEAVPPPPAGWTLTGIDCNVAAHPSSGVTPNINVATGVVTYSIDNAADRLDCTYTNTLARGSITVDKVTDPSGSSQPFEFDPSYGPNFFLTDGSAVNNSGPLLPGIYSVAEVNVPTGWTPGTVSCTGSAGAEDPTAINVGPGENVSCVFNNTARGNIIVHKTVDPASDETLFHFNASYDADGFDLGNSVPSNDSGPLVPGGYSVGEVEIEGYASSGTCDDLSPGGSNPATLTLDPGETINCYFTNVAGASITVVKNVTGPDLGQSFSFTSDFGVTPLTNGGSVTYPLAPNDTYNVTENGVLNWLLTNADPAPGVTGAGGNVVCTSALGNENSSAINLTAGEQVVCTFVNEWQVGAVHIHKTAKHAASETGSIPLAGVEFNILDHNGNVASGGFTDANGDLCIDSFAFENGMKVREVAAAPGYAAAADSDLFDIDNVAYCPPADPDTGLRDYSSFVGETVNVSNTPLTNVTVSVDSQVEGGTASVVACVDTNGDPVALDNDGATGANGDGSFSVANLLPTDPAVTLTCTITIDP